MQPNITVCCIVAGGTNWCISLRMEVILVRFTGEFQENSN